MAGSGRGGRGELPKEPSWLELITGSAVVAAWLGFVVGHWLGMWGG